MKTQELRKILIEEKHLKEWVVPDGTWNRNEDGSIDVDGNVIIQFGFTKLPIKFGTVTKSFICSGVGLKTLEGCPKEVGLNFDCRFNDLTSLDGIPRKVNNFVSYGNPGKFLAKDIRKICNVTGKVMRW